MSDRTIGNASYWRMFYGMIAAMVALTAVLVVIGYLIGTGPDAQRSGSVDADHKSALAERVAPFGGLNVTGPARTTPVAAAPGAATAAPASVAAVDGKATYDSGCAACHNTGVAGAPKIGDAAGWKARSAQGRDTLYQHAIDGFQGKTGMMPAKGGNAALADAAVKAAVDHILAGSQ